MKKNNGGNGSDPEIQKLRDSLQVRAAGIIQYFRAEFGDNLKNNMLILKLITCGKKRCNSCPHGPYWYRAVYNPKTKKWVFRYVKSDLNKGLLKPYERDLWDRYNFYNNEIKNLRTDKRRLVRRG